MQYESAHTKHFELQQLSDRVYAAIAEVGGWAISNSGLMDIGGEVVVFDSFLTPRAAHVLLVSSQHLFGKAPDLVVNSHYHNDHIWGNQAFVPKAKVISSLKTWDLIQTAGQEEYDFYTASATMQLQRARQRYQAAVTDQERAQQVMWLAYYDGLVEELPNLKVQLPSITFSKLLQIHGSKDTCRLISYDDAHTGSDTALYLPKSGIVFMADLLFVRFHPYLGDGNPDKLLAVLKEVRTWDATQYVPGHGPVGTRDDLNQLIDYIEFCMETSQALVKNGPVTAEQVAKVNIPDAYAQWEIPNFFYANLQFLCHSLQPAHASNSGTGPN